MNTMFGVFVIIYAGFGLLGTVYGLANDKTYIKYLFPTVMLCMGITCWVGAMFT